MARSGEQGPLWVTSGSGGLAVGCPLYPDERTSSGCLGMSEKWQEQTFNGGTLRSRLDREQPVLFHNGIPAPARIKTFIHRAEFRKRRYRDCIFEPQSALARADDGRRQCPRDDRRRSLLSAASSGLPATDSARGTRLNTAGPADLMSFQRLRESNNTMGI
jgi:hypothetical protein